MYRRIITSTFAVASVLGSVGLAAAGVPCSALADLDGSGEIDGADLAALLGAWGPCGNASCPADLTGDSTVDGADLAVLLGAWGPADTFDFGPTFDNAEYHQIGLEMLGPTGPLTLDPETYNRIRGDIEIIRATERSLADQFHSPKWAPNQIIIKLLPDEPADDFACHNAYYDVSSIDLISKSLQLYTVTFAAKHNVERMSQMYSALPNIQFAEPNGIIGGQNFWVPTPLGDGVWEWFVEDGWHDCFDGCDCRIRRWYHIEADGNIELVDYEELFQPWCEFKQ